MGRYSILLRETVRALGVASEKRDPYTAGHQSRVTTLAVELCKLMGVGRDATEGIRIASLLHDIGKIGVPIDILSKPGKLSFGEYAIVKDHCIIGHDIIKDINFPWPVARIVLDHHETLDGSGYPNGKKSKDISIETRIVSVADMTDAMLSHRPYHAALTRETVIEELKKGRKKKLDGDVVDACVGLLESGFHFV